MSIQVTTMRYTRRFNVAQYEHEEITVDVVPAEGQTAESLLDETRKFVEASRPKVNGAYIEGSALPPTTPYPVPTAKKRPTKGAKATAPAKSGGTTANSTSDTFAGLLEELDKLVETPVEALEEICNGIAERFRAINKPGDASPLKKQIVEKLVAYKQKIDAALQPA